MIYIASDHAGFKLKEQVKLHLKQRNIDFQDLGTDSEKSVDASDYAVKVAEKIKKYKNFGILICGSGIMMSMAANRIKGIRAALAWDVKIAQQAREHNDANILVLSGREAVCKKWPAIVDVFLNTKFSRKQKYLNRINKLDQIK